MRYFRLLRIHTKSADYLRLRKSFGLYLYELLLIAFWAVIFTCSFLDEAKLGLVNFYRKHLPVGLVLLPLSTKIILLIPLLMAVTALVMLGAGTHWRFQKSDHTVVRRRYFFFGIHLFKKKWSFKEIVGLRLSQKNYKSPFALYLVDSSGKQVFLDRSSNDRKLKRIAQEIAVLTGWALLR